MGLRKGEQAQYTVAKERVQPANQGPRGATGRGQAAAIVPTAKLAPHFLFRIWGLSLNCKRSEAFPLWDFSPILQHYWLRRRGDAVWRASLGIPLAKLASHAVVCLPFWVGRGGQEAAFAARGGI